MSDLLDRAKTKQREQANATTLWITLAFLQDLIAEIERLQRLAPPTTVRAIRDKLISKGEGEPQ